jgi:nitrous-oxide reductase
MKAKRWISPPITAVLALVLMSAVIFFTSCRDGGDAAPAATTGLSQDAQAIANDRGLSPADVTAALKTYVPSGQHDDYIMFSSAGHAGQVFVIGLPSMRILKSIGVFTPEPWQGWGYGEMNSMNVLREGSRNPDEHLITWGDTHHPALSETDGDYDGEYLFINDKAHARLAVISLKDFKTKQIVPNPIALSNHGGAFVTPNTEWVIEGGHYAAPLSGEYAPLSEYEAEYRGMITFWKFDREIGRLIQDDSFAIELPPYWQDLCDAGKLASEGWVFCNSFNTEMAKGGVEKGNLPFESGVSQYDTDLLHVINLERAVEVAQNGGTVEMSGLNVIPLETAIAEGLLYFIPEPKSPHGVDVSPTGEYIVVAGKLDPHVTIYGMTEIKEAIAGGNFDYDDFGVPILDFDETVVARVELGLGPLHTQFGPDGYAYTSLFLDSAVSRWTLGGSYADLNEDPEWEMVGKISVHYNIGHLAVAHGDTVNPHGNYLVSLNKWAVDRFQNVGPLLPQNFQLIDISQPGDQMQLLYDMPIGIGEPHYAQIISADLLDPWEVYPEVGWDAQTNTISPNATFQGEERIVRDGNNVEVFMTSVRSRFIPEHVEIQQGDKVTWHITNVERAYDAIHGFAVPEYNIHISLEPGETATFEFEATRPGVFSYYCTEFCSALHLEMKGYLLVQP